MVEVGRCAILTDKHGRAMTFTARKTFAAITATLMAAPALAAGRSSVNWNDGLEDSGAEGGSGILLFLFIPFAYWFCKTPIGEDLCQEFGYPLILFVLFLAFCLVFGGIMALFS